MWTEQLQAMRVRARSEQRRAAELEGEVRRLGGSLADVTPANDFGSPEPAPQRRDGAGSGEMQMTHKEEEMTDCDTKQRVSDNEILLSLSVSALRSVCFNLLTRMDDAGVRRIAGVEEGGLLETLVHRVLRQRDAPDVDASRACVLSPLSEIWDRIGLRGDADFATDLDLIVGLTGMFLGDSSTTALWKQDTADIAAATPPRTATPRTATRRLRRLELMDDAVAVVPMTH